MTHRASALTPEDTLDILFNSGTTGNPKSVVTCHGQNIRTFENWRGAKYVVVTMCIGGGMGAAGLFEVA